ncbi:hypothetical protein LWI29_025605 [Acer saccharum]|uniref:3'-5' exonuclease domain-containing protein n=1 Tax=Acer saccharum TaxID=4024 RepID=A0AA39T515_ACESA|nr:hypothetical protein LWI29_025605 [Acer saccharum]
MIPFKYLSNMDIYEVEIQGVKVKASLIDNVAVLDAKIRELRSSLFQPKRPHVVGVDVKFHIDERTKLRDYQELLVLCGWNRCLIIQLYNFPTFPDCLHKFLADETICFVGNELYDKVIKNPKLSKCRLAELAGEVGVNLVATEDLKGTSTTDLKAIVFTDEEIKCIIQDANTCCDIGNKLLRMVA